MSFVSSQEMKKRRADLLSSEPEKTEDVDEDGFSKSFKEKMREAYHLACRIAWQEDGLEKPIQRDKLQIGFSDDEFGELWSWIDGLAQDAIIRLYTGQCSLKAMIDFDIEEEESKIDKLIETWRKKSATLNDNKPYADWWNE